MILCNCLSFDRVGGGTAHAVRGAFTPIICPSVSPCMTESGSMLDTHIYEKIATPIEDAEDGKEMLGWEDIETIEKHMASTD